MTNNNSSKSTSINLIIYPSTLENASRIFKIASSLQSSCVFSETHAVGIGKRNLPSSELIAEGTSVIRITASNFSGLAGKVLKILLWQPKVFFRFRFRDDISTVSCHNIWILPMCARLAKVTRSPLVYNAHELETETGAMYGLKKIAAKWIEKKYIYRASLVSVVSNSIADWYAKEYGISRPLVIKNISADAKVNTDLRKRIQVADSEILFVHTGKLTEGRNIPLILETFKKYKGAHVAFLGDGPLSGLVKDASYSHSNIHLEPMVPSNEVVSNMREADVGICLTETGENLSQQFAGPNKLFESLGAGTPPICSNLAEARYLLGELSSEWVLSNVEQEFADAVMNVNKESVKRFRENFQGINSWDREVSPLVDAYLKLMEHKLHE